MTKKQGAVLRWYVILTTTVSKPLHNTAILSPTKIKRLRQEWGGVSKGLKKGGVEPLQEVCFK